MDTSPTTAVDDPADVPAPGAGVIEEPTATEDTKTAKTSENLDPSKSDDTVVTDDDKKSDEDKTTDTNDTPTSNFDDDLDSWIEKRGAPKPTTDAERQAFQDLRNEQREFTRAAQVKKDAKALKDVVDEAKPKIDDEDDEEEDPLEKKVRLLDEQLKSEATARVQSEFLTNGNDGKPINEEQYSTMLDIMKEKFTRPTTEAGKLAAFYQWSSPDALPDLLELAKARLISAVDTSAEQEAARKEERERIAHESNANPTNRGAKDTVVKDKSDDDRRLENFSTW